MRHAAIESKPVAAMKEAAEIIRGVLAGDALDVDGKVFSAHMPALKDDAEAPRWDVPLYFAGTGPMMLRAAAQAADGLLTASITTPAFVRYVRGELEAAGRDPDSLDLGCTIVASIDEDRDQGRDGAREIAGMYLANKVQNIQAAADTLLECAGLTQDEIRPVAEAMEPAGGSPRRRRSPTRSSTSASRSPARPRTASPRSRSTATRAAPTSCWSSGATTASGS